MTWFDIKNAPRDGTRADIWLEPHDAMESGNAHRRTNAYYHDNDWWFKGNDGTKDVAASYHWRVTHWMVIPGAPIQEPYSWLNKLHPVPGSERDIYEVANQLGGFVGPHTEKGLAEFLIRESDESALLADEIVRLRNLLLKHNVVAELISVLGDYAEQCADARTWGGPTIYPPNPINEATAREYARRLKEL